MTTSAVHVLRVVAFTATLASCSPAAEQHEAMDSTAATAVTLATAADEFFEKDSVRLRYRLLPGAAGNSETVVLLHGYGMSLDAWGGEAGHLADSLGMQYRVVALDQRGFGESSKSSNPGRFGRAMGEDVIRLLDHLGVSRAHLVGHSMGALVASYASLHHPDRIASASLVAGPFYPDSAAAAAVMNRVADGLAAGTGLTVFFRQFEPTMPDSIVRMLSAQSLAANDSGSMIAVMRSLGALQVGRAGAAAATVTALVAVGQADSLARRGRDLAAWWPSATLLDLPNADHVTVLPRRELLVAIRSHIASASPTARTASP